MYTVHNTTHTVHCTYKINHVKDKYMHTIQCTMHIQPPRYPAASSVMYFVYVCTIYFSRLAFLVTNNVSCYKQCFLLQTMFLVTNNVSCYKQCFLLQTMFLVTNNVSCYKQLCYIIQFARSANNRIKLSKNGTNL